MARNEVPKNIRASLYIDGKPAQNSIKNVEQVARTLRKELNGLTIGTAEWNAKMGQLKTHQATLSGIRKEINNVGGAFGWLRSELGRFGTLAAGYLGFQFVTSQFQNIISANAKLSDSLADIRRVAGLTENEVRRLDKSFSDLDTRTSKSDLRGIAVIAGKLGVAKDEMLGFVKATDMLVVALGDELGNADQITTQLGKILNVFEGEVTGDGITRLGNAMVKLANDGVATAGFISDFTQRVSGIAKTANMSTGATMGLGAGLEELGARVESSATAVQKLLITIAQDLPGAAKIAGEPVKEFTELFAKAPEEALLRYAEGLTQNKNAFSEIAVAFKDAGEEGVRVIETITKLGERSDFIRGKFEDATIALQGSNEITAAYALLNETLGAKVDKLSKAFYRLTANKAVTGFLVDLVQGTLDAIDWIERNANAISNLIKILTIATISWGAYRIATKLATAEKVNFLRILMSTITLEKLDIVATTSLGLAKALLTGNIKKARQEWLLLNAVMKTNPWGIAVAAITALGAALYFYSGKLSDAEKLQKALLDVQVDAEKSIVAERLAIERSQKTLADDTSNRDKKLQAINDIRNIMPDVLKNYTDEEILAGKATVAIKKQTDAILDQAKARAAMNKITALEERKIDIANEKKSGKYGSNLLYAFGNEIIGGLKGQSAGQPYLDQLSKEEQLINAQIEELEKLISGKDPGYKTLYGLGKQHRAFSQETSSEGNEILYQGNNDLNGQNEAAAKTVTWYDEQINTLKKLQSEQSVTAEQYKKFQSDITALEKERDSITGGNGKKANEKTDKIKKEQEDLRNALKKNMDDIYIDSLLGAEKELAQLDQKYAAMAEKAHGNKDLLKQLDDQYNAEFINLLKKTTEVTEEEASKRSIAEAEAYEQIELAGMSERERELQAIRDHYAELVKLAEEYSLDVSMVMAKWKEAETKLKAEWAKADAEKGNQQAIEERERKYGWAVEGAKLISDTVFSIGENRRKSELDAALSTIEKQRQNELSNENLTEAQKKAINDKYDAKARAERQKAFKADQRAAISQAIINGLVGAGKLWINPGFPAAIPLAAMLAAQTAANVAVIASQKAPQYAVGGFSNQDPAGYVSKATLFNRSASGRPFVAGEAGREWIAPNWMLSSPKYANIIGMLETARQEKRYFAVGGSTEVSTGTGSTGYNFERLEALMSETNNRLREIKELRVVLEYKTFEEKKAEIEYSRYMQGRK